MSLIINSFVLVKQATLFEVFSGELLHLYYQSKGLIRSLVGGTLLHKHDG